MAGEKCTGREGVECRDDGTDLFDLPHFNKIVRLSGLLDFSVDGVIQIASIKLQCQLPLM